MRPPPFLVVHLVNGKAPPTIEVAFDGFARQINLAGFVAVAPRIIAEPVHVDFRDDKLSRLCAVFHQRRVRFQNCTFRFDLIHLIDEVDVLLKKRDVIRSCHIPILPCALCAHYFSGGKPMTARAAAFPSSLTFGVPPIGATTGGVGFLSSAKMFSLSFVNASKSSSSDFPFAHRFQAVSTTPMRAPRASNRLQTFSRSKNP